MLSLQDDGRMLCSITPVIARSATTKQSIKEHSDWIASPFRFAMTGEEKAVPDSRPTMSSTLG
ncbi:MAG: hypothetical protein LBL79_14075 [Prevotella sp.]|nr:hypothetical protein [Prevotella sp.]